jgi:hypothetical protein
MTPLDKITKDTMIDDLRIFREQIDDHAQLGLIRREFADRVIARVDEEVKDLRK